MIDRRPGQQLAFLPSSDADALAECLVAMANADGGQIILGLNTDGSLAEEIWDDDATDTLRRAIEQCLPPVPVQWQPVDWRFGQLPGLRVQRSLDLHTLADGRVLVRHGTENRAVSGVELVLLSANRTVTEFEADLVPGATAADFDDTIIDEYLKKRSERGAALVGDHESLLFEIGAVNRAGQPTVAGILLFGKRPELFLPQSRVVFIRFDDVVPRGGDGEVGYARRRDFEGPLARIVERVWNTVWDEMRIGARVVDLARDEILEYPRFAVREALINAICHRDYRIKGRTIEIRMYSDRLEVISPGGLAGPMTLDNLVTEHYSRNPRIVNTLLQWRYIEGLGLGIDRMIEEMVRSGHPEPVFNATPHGFTVTLYNNRPQRAQAGRNLNERQTRALAYVKDHGSITNGEFQRLFADISPESLRRDLSDLVKRGHLLKIGSKKGTYYILK